MDDGVEVAFSGEAEERTEDATGLWDNSDRPYTLLERPFIGLSGPQDAPGGAGVGSVWQQPGLPTAARLLAWK